MELTYTFNLDCDAHGNPNVCYLTRRRGEGQIQWIADTEFGPFDTWLDFIKWARRSLSVDLDILHG